MHRVNQGLAAAATGSDDDDVYGSGLLWGRRHRWLKSRTGAGGEQVTARAWRRLGGGSLQGMKSTEGVWLPPLIL